jgi:deoxyribose-phosphate aldolase
MDVIEEASRAIEDGADEIDLVIPYRAFLDGDEDAVTEMVRAVRKVCGNPIRLKTILETGVLGQEALIRRATVLSLEAGADFIKTSTGKVKLNATIEAATLILLVLKDYGRNVGFKPAGGIKSIAAAAEYLQIADRVMGAGWARPETFRFGTSSLLEQITGALGGGTITSDISVEY